MATDLPSLLVDIKPGIIDLGWGHPSPRLHPFEEVKEASLKMFQKGDNSPLQYGATQGFGPFLESLATFLSRQDAYLSNVDPHNLFLTAGASQGLDLAATLYADSGDTVLVEEPTYFVIEKIFREHSLNIVGIPTDENGIDTTALQDLLKNGLRPKFLYTIPTFQNPTGSSIDETRRKHLVDLANEYDFQIFADEVYQLIGFDKDTSIPMMSFDYGDKVISFGSFSKILAPGLRTGWIHSSKKVIDKFSDAALTFSGGGFNHYASALIKEVIDLGHLDSNVSNLKKEYLSRAVQMDKSLSEYLGGVVSYSFPKGGYYFWLKFPEGFDSDVFLNSAEASGVSYRPGNAFSESGKFSQYLRLTYTLFEATEIAEGVRRLSMAYRDI